MAKKTNRKDPVAVQELKHPWLVPLLGCVYLILTCMMFQGENKLITLLLILSAIVCVVVRGGTLAKRLTLPALLLGLYVLLDGISTLYAPSGKFALYEFLKVAAAACMALLLTGCEPQRDALHTAAAPPRCWRSPARWPALSASTWSPPAGCITACAA